MALGGVAADRVISLGAGLPAIPERLLLAHARGQVLFIAGAGISRPAGLPDFRQLVVDVYEGLDAAVHAVIRNSDDADSISAADLARLVDRQVAEIQRFKRRDYDVALGMLERRLDDVSRGDSQVRTRIVERLRTSGGRPAPIHHALMRLAHRGNGPVIVTTNFDTLLEDTAPRTRRPATYALAGIPRPSRRDDFGGVLHIHGVLPDTDRRAADLIVTDHDFGEAYLRRRAVADFIYDAARLYHLVLVGYSADDPPMRYLLNAVAADVERFEDLKERFTFVGTQTPQPVLMADWRGRGITPIRYDSRDEHVALLRVLERWAQLSAINGKPAVIEREVRRIVRVARDVASEADRDLLDHLMRRGNAMERRRIVEIASAGGADLSWLDALAAITLEPRQAAAR